MQQIFQVTAQGFAQIYRGIFLDLPNCNHYSCSNFDLPLNAPCRIVLSDYTAAISCRDKVCKQKRFGQARQYNYRQITVLLHSTLTSVSISIKSGAKIFRYNLRDQTNRKHRRIGVLATLYCLSKQTGQCFICQVLTPRVYYTQNAQNCRKFNF